MRKTLRCDFPNLCRDDLFFVKARKSIVSSAIFRSLSLQVKYSLSKLDVPDLIPGEDTECVLVKK